MTETQTTKHYIVNEYDGSKPLVEILEMWESFSGWYWYITEIEKEGYEGVIGVNPDGTEITEFGHAAYGYVCGQDNEWGSIWMPDLEKLTKSKDPRSLVWKVSKDNWFGNSRVITIHNEEEYNAKVEELRKIHEEKYGREEEE